MSIEQFIASLRANTAKEYRVTARYLKLWQAEKKKYPTFVEFFADYRKGVGYEQ